MKRYGVYRVVGDGTSDNAYRSEATDVSGVNTNAIIPADPNDPTMPKYNFALTRTGSQTLAGLQLLTNSLIFPDYPLDGQMSGMESNVAAAWKQSLEAYDWDGNGFHVDASYQSTDSWGSVVDGIMKQLDPVQDIDRFDVSEPS